MQRFASFAAVVPVLALTMFAAPAHADFAPSHLVRSPSGPICETAQGCSHPTDCAVPDTCTTVTDAMGVAGTVCLRDTASEIFCCASAADCPVTGVPVRCVRSPATTGGSPVGLCLYGDRSYCLPDSTSLGVDGIDRFLACHSLAMNPCTDPVTSMLTDFDDGDCDQDGIANIADTHVCIPDSSMCFDAGVPVDAGSPDGGSADAGTTPDLGSTTMDAGTFVPAPPGVSFRGGAGCTCRVSRGGDSTAALAGSAMLVALVVLRRRQSQR